MSRAIHFLANVFLFISGLTILLVLGVREYTKVHHYWRLVGLPVGLREAYYDTYFKGVHDPQRILRRKVANLGFAEWSRNIIFKPRETK